MSYWHCPQNTLLTPPFPPFKPIWMSIVWNFSWDHCNTQEKLKQYNGYAIFILDVNKMYYWQCENGYLYDYNKALVFTKTAKFPVSNTWDHCNTQEKLKQYNCYAIFIWMLTRCIMGNVKMVFCMTITRPLYSQKQLNFQLQIRYDSSLFNASQKIRLKNWPEFVLF